MAVTDPPRSPGATSAPTVAPRRRWQPRAALLRAFAWAAVITNGLITVTGATVRVTGSGLGCSTWPECQPGSLVPEYRTGMAAFHQAVEFGNRTITVLVLVASLGTFVLLALVRPVRRKLLWIAAIGPVGVIFQAVLGGIVVFTGLRWWTVAPHLLISLLLVSAAVVVVVRLREPDRPPTPTVARPLRVLTYVTVVVLAAVCVLGTLVSAAGPHAGDVNTPRLTISLIDLAQFHADLMHLYLGLIVGLGVGLLATHAPRMLLRRVGLLAGLTLAQGILGLVQYRLGVPEVLVLLHVLGAVLLVVAAAFVVLATRTRLPAPDTAPQR